MSDYTAWYEEPEPPAARYVFTYNRQCPDCGEVFQGNEHVCMAPEYLEMARRVAERDAAAEAAVRRIVTGRIVRCSLGCDWRGPDALEGLHLIEAH